MNALEQALSVYVLNYRKDVSSLKTFGAEHGMTRRQVNALLKYCRQKYGVEYYPLMHHDRMSDTAMRRDISNMLHEGYDIDSISSYLSIRPKTLEGLLTRLRRRYGVNMYPHFKRRTRNQYTVGTRSNNTSHTSTD